MCMLAVLKLAMCCYRTVEAVPIQYSILTEAIKIRYINETCKAHCHIMPNVKGSI
jgi:hypothetical protein